jgi:hypothetical protein
MPRVSSKHGLTADGQFARNLDAQEVLAWADYLKRRTPAALKAWRDVRAQLRQAREKAA